MYGLEGRKAIVTGAAHGIGRAIATRLASEGCQVGILDQDAAATGATAAAMARNGGVNLTSWMGKSGVAHHGAYCASKFAIVALTQALASEVGEHGVRVNAAAPGLIVGTKMRKEAEIDRRAKGLETPVSGSSSARTDGGAVRRELPYALKVPPSSPCFTSSVALARQAGGPPWPPAPCN